MKVLSIKQPWASLIVNGYKEYEFRSWKTKFRGDILIHASLGVETDVINSFNEYNLDYPTGVIIGRCTITDCVEVSGEFEDNLILKNELVYGLSKGRASYGFKLDNIKKFNNPITAKGQLGFWNYEGELDD